MVTGPSKDRKALKHWFLRNLSRTKESTLSWTSTDRLYLHWLFLKASRQTMFISPFWLSMSWRQSTAIVPRNFPSLPGKRWLGCSLLASEIQTCSSGPSLKSRLLSQLAERLQWKKPEQIQHSDESKNHLSKCKESSELAKFGHTELSLWRFRSLEMLVNRAKFTSKTFTNNCKFPFTRGFGVLGFGVLGLGFRV